MRKSIIYLVGLTMLLFGGCSKIAFGDREVEIPDFNFPKSIIFEDSLSKYNIFSGNAADLLPREDFNVLELSSQLFTDYAYKQRLVKIPEGLEIGRLSDGTLDFPDGTILTKTFYYYADERDQSLGKRIIETRLLIKEDGLWNIATYVWNDKQTDATLALDGSETAVTWTNSNGSRISTLYQVPSENQCMTCHQSNGIMTHLGPTLRNLNRNVTRNGFEVNQIDHLQSLGIISDFALDQIPQMVDYKDGNIALNQRARAYLAINCAHCHNPSAWDIPANKDFDFRYETSLQNSGILSGSDNIIRNVSNQEMPFIGTTLIDREGVDLIIDYLENL